MNLLKQIFGNKPTTADAIAGELAKCTSERETAKTRIETAKAALSDIATMSDVEHADAEAEHAESVRALARLEARIAGLTSAHADAEKAESDAALLARAKTVKRALDVEVPKLLAEYDAAAGTVANILAKLRTIRVETDAVNQALRRVGVDMYIENYPQRYRKHPDLVTPELRETRTFFVFVDHRTGRMNEIELRDGAKPPYPAQGNYETRDVRVRAEHRVPGLHLESLEDITLPPGHLDSKQHWPRNT
jgi:hypothetical protein